MRKTQNVNFKNEDFMWNMLFLYEKLQDTLHEQGLAKIRFKGRYIGINWYTAITTRIQLAERYIGPTDIQQ